MKMMKLTRKILSYSIAVIVSLCCVCIVAALGVISSGDIVSTPTPTLILISTSTPFIFATLQPPSNNQTSQCVCIQDIYNCGDALAVTCFDYCKAKGYGDIHGLDGDNDGLVCENDK